MNLSKLMEPLQPCQVIGTPDLEITSVEYDSRKVQKGTLFVCIRGYQSDGHNFIKDAAKKGAAAFLVEELPVDLKKQADTDAATPFGQADMDVSELPVDLADAVFIQVKDTRMALALTAAAWFGDPAKKLVTIGLTGTKGKTSTAFMMKQILEEAGHKVGMIGTVGAYIGTEKIKIHNTTPESFELHSLFAQMVEKGCSHVVMEASSQGFKLQRTAGIQFDYGAFLNLSPDHISPLEHKDFEEYRDCKKQMFDQTTEAVVNIDGEHWQYVTARAKHPVTVSLHQPGDLTAEAIVPLWEPGFLGSSFTVHGLYEGTVTLNMPGEYNVSNALIAMAIAARLQIPFEKVQAALKKVSVKGRTQLVREASFLSTFLIDYAHNALSIESLLSMLKSYRPGRLICLFGGGGNRDPKRRYDMGKAAGKYADFTVITTDNPRWEDPAVINSHIIEGLNIHHGSYQVIMDREEAIHFLMDNCKKDDIIALIGKGHEEYQEIQGVKYDFSEEQIIRAYAAQKEALWN